MTDEFEAPAWVTEAFVKAEDLARASNAFWLEQLGDPGLFGGFQVEPTGSHPNILFVSTLFGGRSLTGTADQVTEGSRAYVLSRRRGRGRNES